MNGTVDTLTKAMLGLACAVCLRLSGWALITISDVSEQVKLLDCKVEEMRTDQADDVKQNETLSKHWKLHSWVRDEVNDLRHNAGLESARWPDF